MIKIELTIEERDSGLGLTMRGGSQGEDHFASPAETFAAKFVTDAMAEAFKLIVVKMGGDPKTLQQTGFERCVPVTRNPEGA